MLPTHSHSTTVAHSHSASFSTINHFPTASAANSLTLLVYSTQSEKDAADKEALAQSAAMGSADGEDERAKQVLKDLDTAVRTRVLRLLDEHAATNGRRVTPSSSSHPGDSSFGGAGGDAVDEFDDISAAPALPAGPKPTPSHSTNPFSTGIGFGVGGLGLDDDDPEREKQVLTEIEKFRLRQAQRDK